MWAHVDDVAAQGVYLQGSKLPLSQNLAKKRQIWTFPGNPTSLFGMLHRLAAHGSDTVGKLVENACSHTPRSHGEVVCMWSYGPWESQKLGGADTIPSNQSSKHGIMGKLFENEELWTVGDFK